MRRRNSKRQQQDSVGPSRRYPGSLVSGAFTAGGGDGAELHATAYGHGAGDGRGELHPGEVLGGGRADGAGDSYGHGECFGFAAGTENR